MASSTKDCRFFLDPGQPSLPQVAKLFVQRYRRDAVVEGQRVILVVPGARAGRRLNELILQRVEEHQLAYWPAHVTTVGALPELLYPAQHALASGWIQQLAWCQALQAIDREDLARIVPAAVTSVSAFATGAAADVSPPAAGVRSPEAPSATSRPAAPSDVWTHQRWLHVGELLCGHYRQLAADGYSFADVARITAEEPAFSDSERWQAMALVQEQYLRLLDSLELWDAQTARLVAVRKGECHTDRDIWLVGAVDINRTLHGMLAQVRDRVTALVHAPQSWADRFDAFGALLPDAWQTSHITLDDRRLHAADGPAEQARTVCEVLSGYRGRYRADEIVVGVPDENVVPYIQRAFDEHGVRARWGPGTELSQTGPARALAAVADVIERADMASWGALIRHPDVLDWLRARGVGGILLQEFDGYCQMHVPATLDGQGPAAGGFSQLALAWQNLSAWLAPLHEHPRPLRDWCQAIQATLLTLYGQRDFQRGSFVQQTTWSACQHIQLNLAQFAELPPLLDQPVTAAEALRLVLRAGSGTLLAQPADPAAVELLGWLELLHDDSAAMVVTSVNEGLVPTAVRTDAFLPNALRAHLGLDDNARRYARDAYTLQMLASARRDFDVVVARRAVDDEPLLPSRLLLATTDQQLAQRTLRLLVRGAGDTATSDTATDNTAEGDVNAADRASTPTPLAGPSLGRPAFRAEQSGFRIPRPRPLPEPIQRLSPTQVRQYLACPYRFYLAYVESLGSCSDQIDEMDATLFGTIMHSVLYNFGKGKSRHAKDPEVIGGVLDKLLDEEIEQRFGRNLLPTAQVQLSQLRRRLQHFAVKQGERSRAGWRIEHVEQPARDEYVEFLVDGTPMRLIGRIDRIDVHKEGGAAILDYKSSDGGRSPEETHRQRGEWVDLQLPMYRLLAQCLDLGPKLELGYVVVAAEVENVAFRMAEWTAADYASAEDTLREVIRKIRAEEFWPPAELPGFHTDDYASICMTEVQEQPVNGDHDGAR